MLLDQNQNPNVVNIFKKKTKIWQSFLAKTGILQHNIYFLFFILAKCWTKKKLVPSFIHLQIRPLL
jgi:hypothetical protein